MQADDDRSIFLSTLPATDRDRKIALAVIGISARELNLGTDVMTAQNPTVIKAGGPVVYTDRNGATVR